MRPKLSNIIVSALLLLSLSSHKAEAICIPDPTAVPRLFASTCYSCMFPLWLAGVPVVNGPMPDAGHAGMAALPLCVCPIPVPPFFRVGITVSFYNPDKIFEVVKDPLCSPTFGVDLGASGALLMERGHKTMDKSNSDEIEKLSKFQAHNIAYAPFKALGVLVDFACIQSPHVLDYLYLTEFDPLWQSSTLATIINPEAIILANPITQLACMADSATSLFYTPLDPLFWCMGSMGNAYPLSGDTIQSDNWTQGASAAAGRFLYKLHRELLIWDESGRYTTCTKIPMPIWNKSNYRMQIINPIPHPIGHVVGQSGTLSTWSFGKNIPMSPKSDNFTFMLFSKKGCCAF